MPTNTAIDHHCIDHLVQKHAHCVETHGLDCGPYEQWDEEWDECTVCGERYDDADVADMAKEANDRSDAEWNASEDSFSRSDDCTAPYGGVPKEYTR